MFVRRLLPVLVFSQLVLQGCGMVLSLDEFDKGEETDGGTPGPLVLNLIFRQEVQPCIECGIWFDWQGDQANKPKLQVEFEHLGQAQTNTYQHGFMGMDNAFAFYLSPDGDSAKHMLMVKQAPQRTGLFWADISDIPAEAAITKATLYLHVNTIEGFADVDNTSVLSVHECSRDWNWDRATWTQYDEGAAWSQPGGDFGVLVRKIRAKEDLRDRGVSMAQPNADFDFTAYMVSLQANRSRPTP